MKLSENQQKMLRMLPGVDHILELVQSLPFFDGIPGVVVTNSIRKTLEARRKSILTADQNIGEETLSDERILELVKAAVEKAMAPNLKHLINATGVVVHTNLGRSLLPDVVVDNIRVIAGRYSNLEYDLNAGKRGCATAVLKISYVKSAVPKPAWWSITTPGQFCSAWRQLQKAGKLLSPAASLWRLAVRSEFRILWQKAGVS